MRWTIKVRNYRCFTDENPITFDLSNQMVALIGPNNSGKTTALKFFWELGMTLAIVPLNIVANQQAGNQIRVSVVPQLRPMSDLHSIFCEINNRPIVIDLYQHETLGNREYLQSAKRAVLPVHLRLVIDRNTLSGEIFLVCSGEQIVAENSKVAIQKGSLGTYFCPAHLQDAYYLDHSNLLYGLQNPFFVPTTRSFYSLNSTENYTVTTGRALIPKWKELKGSDSAVQRKIASNVESAVAKIFGYDHLEITTNSRDEDFILKVENSESRLLKDMGSGISHFITIAINLVSQKPSLTLFDEPEIGIHASLQTDLMALIERFAQGPVLFATHSIGLARSVSDKILSFKMLDGQSRVTEFEKSKSHLETLGELSFAAWREIGCDSVVFVEGINDVKVMLEWLKSLGLSKKSVVLPLGGNEMINGGGVEAIKQIIAIHPKVLVIIDSEKTAEDEKLEAKRDEFRSACELVHIPCLVVERRATENYFTESAIYSAVGHTGRALSAFEKLNGHGWGKRDGFKLAAAMTKSEIESTDVGKFLVKHLS
jgi:ABC-type Mn2+/Zn2+ transport system ATPase subunit